MKSGAGDDPFAERGHDTDDRDDPDRTDGGPEQGQFDEPGDTTGETTAPGEPDETGAGGLLGGDATGDESGSPLDAAEIPWVLRRGSVGDDRPNVTQFFLRDETDRAEQRVNYPTLAASGRSAARCSSPRCSPH